MAVKRIILELGAGTALHGGDYTKAVFPALRAAGWKGYWIDAASALRMNDDAVIILDPVNGSLIRESLGKGIFLTVFRDPDGNLLEFVGPNK